MLYSRETDSCSAGNKFLCSLSLYIVAKTVFQLTNLNILNKKHLKCLYCLISSPEKLDVDMVMSIEHLTSKISPIVFYKETYSRKAERKTF